MARRIDSEIQKKKSRDAARQRRGQQNDEFTELASQLPVMPKTSASLDRLCVMRLSNSFVKMKHIIKQITGEMGNIKKEVDFDRMVPDVSIMDALDGFVFVLSQEGQCMFVSPNVAQYLGITQLDLTGCSFYKYVHPCDQEELAKQLGGQVPLEDMEIFDGLFCSDLPSVLKENDRKPACRKLNVDANADRSFFIRMKSTLTSRGKSVNLSASIYRVIHCVGKVQSYRTKYYSANDDYHTTCLIAVGTPLLASPTFDVPLDRTTFTSTHTLDMRIVSMENIANAVLGYNEKELMDKSWYDYVHTCDVDIVKNCHRLMLSKGQSVSGYYRVMTKQGGWIWMLTKGNIVYSNSSFQPQYIININYVVSDVEERGQVLSTEQMQSVIHVASYSAKRILEENNEDAPVKFRRSCSPVPTPAGSDSGSSEENLALLRMEELEKIVRHQEHYENLLAEEYGNNSGDADNESNVEEELPALEVIDSCPPQSREVSTNEESSDSDLLWRAPYVMVPDNDSVLCVPGCSPISLLDDDMNLDEDQDELAARAPFVPPPNDDTILTFNDLPDSPLFAGFENPECGTKMPDLFLEDPFDDSRMTNIGPAVILSSRLRKTVGVDIKTSEYVKKELPDRSSLQSSKHKGSLPCISTTEAEMNAPSGPLLVGDDLLFALEASVIT